MKQRHEEEYGTRVNNVVRQLMDKAAGKNRDFTHREFGADKFDKTALTREAHRHVQFQNLKEMDQLADNEIQELDALIKKAQQRDSLLNKPTQDFNQATDRRDSQERRLNTPRHRRR